MEINNVTQNPALKASTENHHPLYDTPGGIAKRCREENLGISESSIRFLCKNGAIPCMGDAWEEHNKIFTQFRGKPIHPLTITKWLSKFCKDNGLPHTTPHMLRHTSATLLLMQGLPIKAVSKRLGHAQVSTTGDNLRT